MVSKYNLPIWFCHDVILEVFLVSKEPSHPRLGQSEFGQCFQIGIILFNVLEFIFKQTHCCFIYLYLLLTMLE